MASEQLLFVHQEVSRSAVLVVACILRASSNILLQVRLPPSCRHLPSLHASILAVQCKMSVSGPVGQNRNVYCADAS